MQVVISKSKDIENSVMLGIKGVYRKFEEKI